MDGLAVSGEVVTAATALAGLILVYIGSLASAYGAFQPQEQKTVRGGYLTRAWLSFVGMAFALAAAMLGVLGKWLSNGCISNAAIVILLLAFVWGAAIAILTVREIK
jgi:hypothetical protein